MSDIKPAMNLASSSSLGMKVEKAADVAESELGLQSARDMKNEPMDEPSPLPLPVPSGSAIAVLDDDDEPERSLAADGPRTCVVCFTTFGNAAALAIHVRESKHTNMRMRTHKCGVCSTTFTNATALADHARTNDHVRKRPHECHVCHLAFTKRANRERHMKKQHPNVRTYKCDVCGMSFASAAAFTQHSKKHARQRHECDMCEMTFSARSNLDRHVQEHMQAHDDGTSTSRRVTRSSGRARATMTTGQAHGQSHAHA